MFEALSVGAELVDADNLDALRGPGSLSRAAAASVHGQPLSAAGRRAVAQGNDDHEEDEGLLIERDDVGGEEGFEYDEGFN